MDFLKELEKVVGDEFSSLAETLNDEEQYVDCLLYTSPSPRDRG